MKVIFVSFAYDETLFSYHTMSYYYFPTLLCQPLGTKLSEK